MLALFRAAPWPAVMVLLLAVVALAIWATILVGLGVDLGVDDVGSWRWWSGRPI